MLLYAWGSHPFLTGTMFGLQSGEAMSLECQCRGELALRHRSCAEKWSRVKVSSYPQVLLHH